MKRILTPALILISLGSFSQSIDRSVVATAGNHVDSETFSISWTLGETAVSTMYSEGLVLSQGFHQGSLFVDAFEGLQPDFRLKTYPNPVIDKLMIESPDQHQMFEIIDVNGRVVQNGFITSDPFELDFTNLPSGTYFLRVEQRFTHRVIKMQ